MLHLFRQMNLHAACLLALPWNCQQLTTYRGRSGLELESFSRSRENAEEPAGFAVRTCCPTSSPYSPRPITRVDVTAPPETVLVRVDVQEQRSCDGVLRKDPWRTAEPAVRWRALCYFKGALLGCKTGQGTLWPLPSRDVYFPKPWIWLASWFALTKSDAAWVPSLRSPEITNRLDKRQMAHYLSLPPATPDNESKALTASRSIRVKPVETSKFPADPSPSCKLKKVQLFKATKV